MPIVNPDEKRIRALMMLEQRIKHGKTLKEVAEDFNVSLNTVKRTLSWARKADLVVEAEDRILQELVPAAHQALLNALQGDNGKVAATAAIEIFKGILPTFAKKSKDSPNASSGEDLSRYIDRLRTGEGLLEGQTLPALPAAEAETTPEGDGEPNLPRSAEDTTPECPEDVGH